MKSANMSTQESRRRIRDLLPPGFLKTLRERTGKTRQHIYSVIKHERKSSEVWLAALELAKEHMEAEKYRVELEEELLKDGREQFS